MLQYSRKQLTFRWRDCGERTKGKRGGPCKWNTLCQSTNWSDSPHKGHLLTPSNLPLVQHFYFHILRNSMISQILSEIHWSMVEKSPINFLYFCYCLMCPRVKFIKKKKQKKKQKKKKEQKYKFSFHAHIVAFPSRYCHNIIMKIQMFPHQNHLNCLI